MLPIFSRNSSTEDNKRSDKQNKCRKWVDSRPTTARMDSYQNLLIVCGSAAWEPRQLEICLTSSPADGEERCSKIKRHFLQPVKLACAGDLSQEIRGA